MKKTMAVCLLALVSFVLVGCSSSTAVEPEKETDYTPIIEAALKGNQEYAQERSWDSGKVFERNKSNIMVWEDENNYFVYLRKNRDSPSSGDYQVVYGDGYKIGKDNDKWSSSPDDRSQIIDYLNDNEPPIYEEENVELADNEYRMR